MSKAQWLAAFGLGLLSALAWVVLTIALTTLLSGCACPAEASSPDASMGPCEPAMPPCASEPIACDPSEGYRERWDCDGVAVCTSERVDVCMGDVPAACERSTDAHRCYEADR